MLYQVSTFISDQLKTLYSGFSKDEFEYNFRKNCIRKTLDPKTKRQFTAYKNALTQKNNFIDVKDFGAGSKVFKSNRRKVGSIARIAGISSRKAFKLLKILRYYKPKNLLEIGTSLGIGTYALHLGAPKSKIISVEGCPNTSEIAETQLKKFGVQNVEFTIGKFEEILEPLLSKTQFDFIYFDGNHSKTGTLNYFNWAVEKVHSGSIFIFDDIHWSKEMRETWKIIQKHPKVKSFVTTYDWGLLFF